MTENLWFVVALGAVTLISLAALCCAVYVLMRQREYLHEIHKRLQTLRLDMNSMNSGSLGVGKRLQEVEKKLIQQQDTGALDEQGYEPYSRATRMFDSGANVDEVVHSCGITRAEAELMGLMHKQMKRRGSHPW